MMSSTGNSQGLVKNSGSSREVVDSYSSGEFDKLVGNVKQEKEYNRVVNLALGAGKGILVLDDKQGITVANRKSGLVTSIKRMAVRLASLFTKDAETLNTRFGLEQDNSAKKAAVEFRKLVDDLGGGTSSFRPSKRVYISVKDFKFSMDSESNVAKPSTLPARNIDLNKQSQVDWASRFKEGFVDNVRKTIGKGSEEKDTESENGRRGDEIVAVLKEIGDFITSPTKKVESMGRRGQNLQAEWAYKVSKESVTKILREEFSNEKEELGKVARSYNAMRSLEVEGIDSDLRDLFKNFSPKINHSNLGFAVVGEVFEELAREFGSQDSP